MLTLNDFIIRLLITLFDSICQIRILKSETYNGMLRANNEMQFANTLYSI